MNNVPTNSEKKLSVTVHIVKFFAVFSIVSAHVSVTGISGFLLSILRRFSSIGVIAFFICSALFFNPKEQPFKEFVKKKTMSIVIPWIFIGSIVYVLENFTGNLSILNLVLWLVGYKTYLWYIPVLLIVYLVFYKLYENMAFCLGCIAVTIVSLMLTAFGVLDSIITLFHITNYLFLPNWLGVFALGCLIRKFNLLDIIFNLKKWQITVLCIIYCSLLIISAFVEPMQSGYFSKFGIYLELIALFILFYFSYRLPCLKIVKMISTYSYSIYLLHLFSITIVVKLISFLPFIPIWISVFNFIFVTMLTFMFLFVGLRLAHLLKVEKLFLLLTGVRKIMRKNNE